MPTYGSGPCIALTEVLGRLPFRDRSKETVGCYGVLVGSALSIRAEYMRSGFGDGQSWRFEIDEMSFLDSVYKPGNQLHARLPVFTSQAITKQAPDFTSFYLPTIAKTYYCLLELTRVGTSR